MVRREDVLRALLVHHRRLRSPEDVGWTASTSSSNATARASRGRPRTFVSGEMLAKRAGVSKLTYQQTEHGVREPKASELEEIATLLQMTWRARAALFRRALGC